MDGGAGRGLDVSQAVFSAVPQARAVVIYDQDAPGQDAVTVFPSAADLSPADKSTLIHSAYEAALGRVTPTTRPRHHDIKVGNTAIEIKSVPFQKQTLQAMAFEAARGLVMVLLDEPSATPYEPSATVARAIWVALAGAGVALSLAPKRVEPRHEGRGL